MQKDGSKTEKYYDANGKVTKEVSVAKDGSKTETTYNADGSTVTKNFDSKNTLLKEVTTKDGSTVTKNYTNGKLSSEISVQKDGSKTEYVKMLFI